jgi:hypothetical protein
VGGRAIGTEQDLFGLLRVDHHDQQRLDIGGQRGGRGSRMGAGLGQLAHRFRPHVAGMHLEACAQQRLPDTDSHRAQSDDPDAFDLLCHVNYSRLNEN